MAALATGYFTVVEDPDGHWLDIVSGALPPALTGTLFRCVLIINHESCTTPHHSNGPGRFEVGADAPYSHPYDGDGLVCAFTFSNGRAFFRSRFVRTPELHAELEAGRVLFRNAFATQRAGAAWANALDTYVKNTANTNVVCWGGRCLALFEVRHMKQHILLVQNSVARVVHTR